MASGLVQISSAEDSSSIKVEAREASDLHESGASAAQLQDGQAEDKLASRQKRKRTSPEDQAILEDAYQRDPKPDKAARLAIVKKVALGEKEVQIWFQNRRQSSRRKSKPLQPHEIAQYHVARYGVEPGFHPASLPDKAEPVQYAPAPSLPPTGRGFWMPGGESIHPQLPPIHLNSHDDPTSFSSISQSTPNTSFSHSGSTLNSQSNNLVATPVDRLRRSRVRLSMSCDGNASITTKDANSPSPAKPRSTASGLKQGDGTTATPDTDSASRTRMNRSMSGRSRDSRAWEFWCDKDSRSELEDKAEKDVNGSAVGAIGLLRSASGRSILGPVSNKRNSLLQRQPADSKRSRLDSKGRSLHRSSTSHGRLQGGSEPTTKPRLKHSESAVYIPGNESDKENWSPGESHGHEKDTAGKGGRKADPEADAEIAAFMRGGRESNSLSSDDDLNCVQGLLSLSRGGR